jgi:hypothetical protein
MIAAIVGGGLKAFGIEIPVLRSGKQQLGLGVFGIVLIAGSLYKPPTIDHAALSAELQKNNMTIEKMKHQLSDNEALDASMEQNILSLASIMTNSDATDRQRAEAQAMFGGTRSNLVTLRETDDLLQKTIDRLEKRDREIEQLLSNN